MFDCFPYHFTRGSARGQIRTDIHKQVSLVGYAMNATWKSPSRVRALGAIEYVLIGCADGSTFTL